MVCWKVLCYCWFQGVYLYVTESENLDMAPCSRAQELSTYMIVGERGFLNPNVLDKIHKFSDASNSKDKNVHQGWVYPAPVGIAGNHGAPPSEIGNGQLCARAAGVRRTYMARIGLRQ